MYVVFNFCKVDLIVRSFSCDFIKSKTISVFFNCSFILLNLLFNLVILINIAVAAAEKVNFLGVQ